MYSETAKNIRENLRADCSKCFGLCCTALNIVASSDFAINKPAETPCPNLQQDFRCKIHKNLRVQGFKGCTVFDCLGAGQKVSQHTFKGQSWREHPEVSKKMFSVFPVMEQLYEMIAFVAEALTYKISNSLRVKLSEQLDQLQGLTNLDADQLLALDMISCRQPVNALLLETSEYIRNELSANVFKIKKGKQYRGVDWVGKNLKGKDLRTTDLRGAYLIAADLHNADLRGVDLIGADLRDANVRGANLSTSMFLTQMQINSAKGNSETKLPTYIQPPTHWLSGK
ncbi:pentapeptide repeat-containing protein [Metasolibacillus meyeri]|uniref:pentapeptide repeat-containing protein n=1 Tax=Metasolibacillus meyeri TaxID=1071052 RepID=UPI000D2F9896|nr:pentapeptide repeat-containing protein [Metasolibacillus meyeri]